MFRLLQADGNISINKNLIHAIGLNEAIIYCELLSRHSYFEDRGKLQEDGSFFNTIYDLQFGTGLCEKAQRTAIKNLEKLALLKCKVKGVPARRYFYINFNADMEDFIIQGEEKLEELKRLITEKPVKSTVPPKEETSSFSSRQLDTAEGGSNNTNNKTKEIILIKEGSSSDEIREGTSLLEATPNSLPFFDFVLELLKKYRTDYRKEIFESIAYYYKRYSEMLGEEHIRYREETLIEIISRLDLLYSVGINDEDMNRVLKVDIDSFKEMVNQHFRIKYNGIKYTLLSFLNDNVLKNRYYEVCY